MRSYGCRIETEVKTWFESREKAISPREYCSLGLFDLLRRECFLALGEWLVEEVERVVERMLGRAKVRRAVGSLL